MQDDDLMRFFGKLDRMFFLDDPYKGSAAVDAPLPIGYGQTISQPTLVLQMTRLLELKEDCEVLEIGTGSGYQTAFLAAFAGDVFTCERIPALIQKAKKRLDALGYTNIHYKTGDGSTGWSEHAPYDRIITTAAAARLPDELIKQLGREGKMIAPVGPRGWQDLLMIQKDEKGGVGVSVIEKVAFVELKGEYGWGGD